MRSTSWFVFAFVFALLLAPSMPAQPAQQDQEVPKVEPARHYLILPQQAGLMASESTLGVPPEMSRVVSSRLLAHLDAD